ncbi:hypothetical protein D9615_006872 [Tricholomella constricta]|uniref:DUF6699 domain-containing protein n=1 Tax=Tricholomella constricta TaxID=117010 RepID=A0A8H5H954_9AGAR|nr:hypothetical protein D9615_006872 [Tricholomella constricta]
MMSTVETASVFKPLQPPSFRQTLANSPSSASYILPTMPGKHVRFSRVATVHSPPTPSLSFSNVSSASSAAPLTPPSYIGSLPGPSPYVVSFPTGSQTTSMKPVRIHALLQSSSSPALDFDLTLPPSTITSRHQGISLRALSEPATNPPVSVITIIVPHLPWSITVRPSHGTHVTVSDVLEEIYRKLRTNISSQEFHALPSEKDRQRVTAAYEQRYRRIRSSREYEDEKRRGVRRVDFLMRHTRFMGLSSTSRGPDVWVLNTA